MYPREIVKRVLTTQWILLSIELVIVNHVNSTEVHHFPRPYEAPFRAQKFIEISQETAWPKKITTFKMGSRLPKRPSPACKII